jgi:hypothetical protein
MPDLKFNCPHCKQSLEAPEDILGQLIDCPTCNQPIKVPITQVQPSAPPPFCEHPQKEPAQNYSTPEQNELKEKSIPLAIGLNLLWPGIGYMYMGNIVLGLCVLILIPIFIIVVPIPAFSISICIVLQVVMLIDMLILGKEREKEIAAANTKVCPKCAETINCKAIVCPYG